MINSKNGSPSINSVPDLVIRCGIIITMAKDGEIISDADIIIIDGKIAGIQKTDQTVRPYADKTEIIDATDAIVMPGLINAHTHIPMTLFRGLADDMPLTKWLFDKIFPAESEFLNPETVYYGSLLGCLEMIASGTTCFADGYFFQDSSVHAVMESGLRALVAQGVIDFPAPGIKDPSENLNLAKKFIERWINISDLIKPGIFCHSPVTCSAQTLKGAWKISKEFNIPLQIHLSETIHEVNDLVEKTQKRPVHYLDQLGIIDKDLIAAHCVHLDHEEIDLLKKKEVKIVHVPESNMKLGSGVAKVSEMIDMGLTVGLGTDGCASNNNLDMLCEMDTATKLCKVFTNDPTALDAMAVLKMATIHGANTLGIGEKIGSIQTGKQADIIVIGLNTPHMCPLHDPISSVVYSAKGTDVRDVVVNGKVLMKNRQFSTISYQDVMGKVSSICAEIKKKAGRDEDS